MTFTVAMRQTNKNTFIAPSNQLTNNPNRKRHTQENKGHQRRYIVQQYETGIHVV